MMASLAFVLSQKPPPRCIISVSDLANHIEQRHNVGALTIRIGFWGISTLTGIRNPKNSIGKYLGPCISIVFSWKIQNPLLQGGVLHAQKTRIRISFSDRGGSMGF